MFEANEGMCAAKGKSKLQIAADARYFTEEKMSSLGGVVNNANSTCNRLEAIAEKIDSMGDVYGTAGALLDRAVEVGDTEAVDTLVEQLEAITEAMPEAILKLEKVLGLNKKAKKTSKEDAAKLLGL